MGRLVGGLVGVALVVSGCAAQAQDAKATDVCAQVDDLRDAMQDVRDLDAATLTADQVKDSLGRLRTELDQVMAAADGTARTDAAALREAIADLRATVVAAGPDALTTARPLVAEQLDAVRDAAQALQRDVAATCGTR